jgi:hypothetical protein
VVWRVPVARGARAAAHTTPDGVKHAVPVEDGRAVTFGDRAGFYRLASGSDAAQSVTEFAANLSDLDESRISPQKTLAVANREAPPPAVGSGGVRREIWLWLLAAVLALSVLEWITYHRRVTV